MRQVGNIFATLWNDKRPVSLVSTNVCTEIGTAMRRTTERDPHASPLLQRYTNPCLDLLAPNLWTISCFTSVLSEWSTKKTSN